MLLPSLRFGMGQINADVSGPSGRPAPTNNDEAFRRVCRGGNLPPAGMSSKSEAKDLPIRFFVALLLRMTKAGG